MKTTAWFFPTVTKRKQYSSAPWHAKYFWKERSKQGKKKKKEGKERKQKERKKARRKALVKEEVTPSRLISWSKVDLKNVCYQEARKKCRALDSEYTPPSPWQMKKQFPTKSEVEKWRMKLIVSTIAANVIRLQYSSQCLNVIQSM